MGGFGCCEAYKIVCFYPINYYLLLPRSFMDTIQGADMGYRCHVCSGVIIPAVEKGRKAVTTLSTSLCTALLVLTSYLIRLYSKEGHGDVQCPAL